MTDQMKIGVVLPHGEGDATDGDEQARTLGWRDLRAWARQAEALGLDSLWVFDHLLSREPGEPDAGLHEAWTVLTATAAATERVALGALVMCTSFRNPALLAKMATTLDEISAGRLILGLGCGWHDPEYEAFGYPIDHKVGRFEEALEVIRPLLRGETVTFEGRWVQAREARLLPVPTRLDIPILIAAKRPRMLGLTVRHAEAWNAAWFAGPDDERFVTRVADIRAACVEAGRDPATLELTVGIEVRPAGRPDRPDDRPAAVFVGSEAELADRLAEWHDVGIGHVIAYLSPSTPDVLEWFGRGVARYRSG